MRYGMIWLVALFALIMSSTPASADSEKQWESLRDAGLRLYRAGRYTQGLQQLKSALTEARKFGPLDARVDTSLNDLAQIESDLGNSDAAESLYRELLALRKTKLGPGHPQVAAAQEDYARLLRNMKREQDAIQLEAEAQAIREGKIVSNPIGVASMEEDGTISMRLRAEGHGAVGDGSLTYPPTHPEYAKILSNIGGLRPGQTKWLSSWPELKTLPQKGLNIDKNVEEAANAKSDRQKDSK